jgi:hypothetical protein
MVMELIEMEIDPIKATLTIMEECLQQTSGITTSIATTSYTSTRSTRGLKRIN